MAVTIIATSRDPLARCSPTPRLPRRGGILSLAKQQVFSRAAGTLFCGRDYKDYSVDLGQTGILSGFTILLGSSTLHRERGMRRVRLYQA